MKQHVRLIGYVLIGFGSTCAGFLLHWLLTSVGPLGSAPGSSPQSLFSFLFISTLSLLLGGGVTGYLDSQHVKTKLGFVWITPGLYLLALDIALFIHYADRMLPDLPEAMLLAGVLMFVLSWAGVGIGHYVRCEILKDQSPATRR